MRWIAGKQLAMTTLRAELTMNQSIKRTRVRHTIEEMQALAASRGGRCLSDKYVNTFSQIRMKDGQKRSSQSD
jgi:hypothetical protein